jgi:hypothetical protein
MEDLDHTLEDMEYRLKVSEPWENKLETCLRIKSRLMSLPEKEFLKISQEIFGILSKVKNI